MLRLINVDDVILSLEQHRCGVSSCNDGWLDVTGSNCWDVSVRPRFRFLFLGQACVGCFGALQSSRPTHGQSMRHSWCVVVHFNRCVFEKLINFYCMYAHHQIKVLSHVIHLRQEEHAGRITRCCLMSCSVTRYLRHQVTEPYGICDGVYEGEGDRMAYTTLRGPTLFTATCFEGDCGDGLSA